MLLQVNLKTLKDFILVIWGSFSSHNDSLPRSGRGPYLQIRGKVISMFDSILLAFTSLHHILNVVLISSLSLTINLKSERV